MSEMHMEELSLDQGELPDLLVPAKRMGDVEPLPWLQRISYGFGHVLNDLCASIWFSYLLLYFESINLFTNALAGFVMLLGQVADAVSTPFVGIETDRGKGFCGYTNKKSWHAIGTVCVLCSFPFIFNRCINCSQASDWAQFIYYSPFIIIFQFGWASTQISHLSLIPQLTPDESSRVELNAIRYAFTVLSNIMVYGLTWLLLTVDGGAPGEKLGPRDAVKFRDLTFIVIGIGAVFSLLFHVLVKEPSAQEFNSNETGVVSDYGKDGLSVHTQLLPRTHMIWRDWLKEHQFYLMAFLYMCTRLIVNISQIYLPMYIVHSVLLAKHYVAIIPLVVFISGFAASFVMRPLNKLIGRKPTYLLGLLFVAGSCVWMWFLKKSWVPQMFGAAVLLGAGTSTVLVTSLAMTADLIGNNVKSGAFVYGAMSFTDKIANGLAVILIQYFHPCKVGPGTCCAACAWYYRYAIVFVPGGIAVIAVIVLIVLAPMTLGRLRTHQGHDSDDDEYDESGRDTSPLIHGNRRVYEDDSGS